MIKNNLGVDAISRKAVLNLPKRTMKNYFGEVVGDVVYVKDIMELPPVIPQEPTSKNDLGVDCISRADAIRVASGYCHPSNVAKELAKLPPVTPQEPILDKIRAEIVEEMLSHSGTGEEVIQAYADGLKKGLDILDKYKVKSEVNK